MDRNTWMKIGILAATVLFLTVVLVLAIAGGNKDDSATRESGATDASNDSTETDSVGKAEGIGGTGLVSGDKGENQPGSNQEDDNPSVEIVIPDSGNLQDPDGEANVPPSVEKPKEDTGTESDGGKEPTQGTEPVDPEHDEDDAYHSEIDVDDLFGGGK